MSERFLPQPQKSNPSQYVAEIAFAAAQSGERLYALVDAAKDPRICIQLKDPSFLGKSLHHPRLPAAVHRCGLYLIWLEAESDILSWLLEEGWDNGWALLCLSPHRFSHLAKHFQGLAHWQQEDGKPVQFRYFDPRMLSLYLPTCLPEELRRIFGPIGSFLLPGVIGETVEIWNFDQNQLRQASIRADINQGDTFQTSPVAIAP